jgi:mRNA interferase RelE/StbE
LPEKVRPAVYEFIVGPLLEDLHRVGRPVRWDLTGQYSARRGEYRVVYQIDDDVVVVTVINVKHRRAAYRS